MGGAAGALVGCDLLSRKSCRCFVIEHFVLLGSGDEPQQDSATLNLSIARTHRKYIATSHPYDTGTMIGKTHLSGARCSLQCLV
jgi:hypothetical protein